MYHKRHGSLCSCLVLLSLVLISGWWLGSAYRHYLRTAYPLRHSDSVMRYAEQYRLDPTLIFALIRTESGFDPQARSLAGAYGLMQITEDTYAWARTRLGEPDNVSTDTLYDPDTNIRYGTAILSLLREQFADQRTLLAAYNAGIGRVWQWLDDPAYSNDGRSLHTIPFAETAAYVETVPRTQSIYRQLYEFS